MPIINKNSFKILLIGNLGQLGSDIEKILIFNKYNYKSINRSQIDLTNFEYLQKYLNQNKFDLIINCAAYTNVDLAEEEKVLANILNAELPKLLAIYCKKNSVVLIHFSTDFVFNGFAKKNYDELDEANPINVYGNSKLLGEQNIIKYLDNYLILRVSSVFGNSKNNFIYKIIKNIKTLEKFNVVQDQTSSPTSSNFVSFIINLIIKRLENKKIEFGIYHSVPRGLVTKYELAIHVKNLMKANNINFDNKILNPINSSKLSFLAKRPIYSVLNSKKLEKQLQIKFEDWSFYGNVKIMEILNEIR